MARTYQGHPTSNRGSWVIIITLPEKNCIDELFYGFPRNSFPRNAFPQNAFPQNAFPQNSFPQNAVEGQNK